MITLAWDRLPIIISNEKLFDFISVDNRRFVNFNKSNFVDFREFPESTFAALTILTDIIIGERRFRKMFAAATARFTFGVRMCEIRPNFPDKADVLANERDTFRHVNPCALEPP